LFRLSGSRLAEREVAWRRAFRNPCFSLGFVEAATKRQVRYSSSNDVAELYLGVGARCRVGECEPLRGAGRITSAYVASSSMTINSFYI
jgi:hypothetical protein